MSLKRLTLLVICLGSLLLAAATGAQPDTSPATGPTSRPGGLAFTYLVADAVNFGSTAFRVGGDGAPVIYIEAFPKRAACKSDPREITKADLIIQNVHGHASHHDPDTCAQVVLKAGALVLGNDRLRKDMLARKVPADRILTLNPKADESASVTIDSLKIKVTSYRMEHTMMRNAFVETFLVEMPDGTRWYHGTCSSGPTTLKRMATFAELKDLDVMIVDCDMPFAELAEKYHPRAMIKDHDFQSKVRPAPATVYTQFPKPAATLGHGDTWTAPAGNEAGK